MGRSGVSSLPFRDFTRRGVVFAEAVRVHGSRPATIEVFVDVEDAGRRKIIEDARHDFRPGAHILQRLQGLRLRQSSKVVEHNERNRLAEFSRLAGYRVRATAVRLLMWTGVY